MTDFADIIAADARLVILRELAAQTDGRLNETLLTATLDAFGLRRTRDFVRAQIRALAEIGAVRVSEAGTVMIAAITRAGLDHVERRDVLPGVARPSPEG